MAILAVPAGAGKNVIDPHLCVRAGECVAPTPARRPEGVGVIRPYFVKDRAFWRRVQVAHHDDGSVESGCLPGDVGSLLPTAVAVLLNLGWPLAVLMNRICNAIPH